MLTLARLLQISSLNSFNTACALCTLLLRRCMKATVKRIEGTQNGHLFKPLWRIWLDLSSLSLTKPGDGLREILRLSGTQTRGDPHSYAPEPNWIPHREMLQSAGSIQWSTPTRTAWMRSVMLQNANKYPLGRMAGYSTDLCRGVAYFPECCSEHVFRAQNI